MASPVTIQPSTADTWLIENGPTLNKATDYYLQARPTAGSRVRSLLCFDFSAVVPTGSTITLATLSLYCGRELASRTITVYRLLHTDWVVNQATWNIYKTGASWTTAGALSDGNDFTSTDAANATSVAAYSWLSETVTAQVQTALDSVSGVAHFLLADAGASNNGYTTYYSNENTAAYRPKLYIEYAVPSHTSLNIGDTFKAIDWTGSKINVGDTWKAIAKAQVNIGDVWKDVYNP